MKPKFELYFHLGLPKVASTFLQKEIFPHLENITFHRKRKFNDYKDIDPTHLTTSHLFSSEYDRGLEEVVDDITTRFPNPKIIFLVRRHDKWILSKYKYYIRKHGSIKFEDFINLDTDEGLWKQEELLFQNKIEYIEKHCQVKPLILPLYLLKSKPDYFFQQICQYTGTSLKSSAKKGVVVNKAFNEKQLIVLRKFNALYPYKELQTSYKLLNKIHYKYREFLLHIIAFLARLTPHFFIAQKTLIEDQHLLEQIKAYYAKDWAYCLEYAKAPIDS